jgi:archaemetzincin
MVHLKLLDSIFLFSFFIFLNTCTPGNKSLKNNDGSKNQIYRLDDFKKLAKLQTKLGTPKPGEWLYCYNETGQSYMDYCYSKPVCPHDSVNKIYILPLGNFSEIEKKLLSETGEFVGMFFMLEVKILDPISDGIVPEASRRGYLGFEQLQTKYILQNILEERMPKDAISYIAITNKDLFPDENWNFVFGQANLTKRTGVSSFFRYTETSLDTSNYLICLKRTMKTTCHELCHMFSIKHCRIYQCQINGANHLDEADSKPFWLCPECLAKLQWCIQFDLIKRYDKLIGFFSRINAEREVKFFMESKEIMKQTE